MSTSLAVNHFLTLPDTKGLEEIKEVTCQEAFRGCIPSFVFSVHGQTEFRASLEHILTCTKRDCATLRKKVKDGMHDKLYWLFTEDVLLGCIHIQPLLYGSRTIVDIHAQRNFVPIATHLASCPSESCGRLRRSLLLKVRDYVSPANSTGKED